MIRAKIHSHRTSMPPVVTKAVRVLLLSARNSVMLAVGVVLLFAIGLQFRGPLVGQESDQKVDLRQVLGGEVAGWSQEDLPIGETEAGVSAAEKTLRFDQYFYRKYQRMSVTFTIYVAYWLPGKLPPQMIAQHTPDMCWTLNGFTCEEQHHNVDKRLGDQRLWPAQWRKFRSPSGETVYTLFWHMIGDRPYDYGTRFYDVPHPVTFWWEALRFAAGKRREQFFFRITSSVPPEELWGQLGFQQAVQGFLALGLGKAGGGPANTSTR